jgi:ribosome-binding factor A
VVAVASQRRVGNTERGRRGGRLGRGRGGLGGESVDDSPSNSDAFGPRATFAPRDHKTDQLCRQVERRLAIVFAGEVDDPILRDVAVDRVVPDPTGGLLVLVTPPARDGPSPLAVLERLAAAQGWLRSEIASAIHRKRTPRLSFAVAHPDDEP